VGDTLDQLNRTLSALDQVDARCGVLINTDFSPEFDIVAAERERLCAEAAQLQAQIGREICDRCSR